MAFVYLLINLWLVMFLSLLTTSDLMIIQLGNVFVVNVYLPDASISGRNEIISDICSQTEDNIDLHDDKSFVIIGGDFNLEFKNGSPCCQDLNSFISDFDLYVCDSNFNTDVGYSE